MMSWTIGRGQHILSDRREEGGREGGRERERERERQRERGGGGRGKGKGRERINQILVTAIEHVHVLYLPII